MTAALFVPAVTLGALGAAEVPDPFGDLADYVPLQQGSTWVYDTTVNGESSGLHIKQVVKRATVIGHPEAVAITSHYDNYLALGAPDDSLTYLAVDDGAIVQPGFRNDGEFTSFDPVPTIYSPPFDRPHISEYEGKMGSDPVTFDVELVETGPVTAGGRDYTDCVHFRSNFELTSDSQTFTEQVDEWLCRGVGAVKIVDRLPERDIVIEEELKAFVSPGHSVGGLQPAGDLSEAPVLPSQLGNLAFTDTRARNVSLPPTGAGDIVVLAEEDGRVSATDISTGQIQWSLNLVPPIVARPVTDGASVFVADASKSVFALDMTTGRAVWARSFPDVVSSQPLLADGLIYVQGDDRVLRALDSATGREAWSARLSGLARFAPVLADGTLIVATDAGEVTGFDASGGEELWSAEAQGSLGGSLFAHDGRVFVTGTDGYVDAYDTGDGTLLWSAYPGDAIASFAATGSVVVALTLNEVAFAYDASDGRLLWTDEMPGAVSLVGSGNLMVVVTGNGGLRVIDPATGAVGSERKLPYPSSIRGISVDIPAVFVGDHLFVVAEQDYPGQRTTLYGLDVSGNLEDEGISFDVQERRSPASPMSAATLVGSSIYFGAAGGVIYRISADGTAEQIYETGGLVPFITPLPDGKVLVQEGKELIALEGDRVAWRAPVGADPYPGAEPIVNGDIIFMPQHTLGLAAFSLDGERLWVHASAGVGAGKPVPVGDGVVFASGALVRLDARGREVWGIDGLETFGQLAGDGDTIFVEGFIDGGAGVLLAVDARSGDIRWQKPYEPGVLAGPATAEGVVVAIDPGGLVQAFDAGTGDELWTVTLQEGPAASPLISEGAVYLLSKARWEDLFQGTYRVIVKDLHTGRFLASYEPPGAAFEVTPVASIADGKLVLPTSNAGPVYELLEPQR